MGSFSLHQKAVGFVLDTDTRGLEGHVLAAEEVWHGGCSVPVSLLGSRAAQASDCWGKNLALRGSQTFSFILMGSGLGGADSAQ